MRHQSGRRAARAVILAGTLQLVANGCGHDACTADYRYGLVVTVVRPSTGTRSCNATVAVTDGAYREILATAERNVADGGVECVYQGAGERPGTYTIEVNVDGSSKAVTGIVVKKDECHVIPLAVTIDP